MEFPASIGRLAGTQVAPLDAVQHGRRSPTPVQREAHLTRGLELPRFLLGGVQQLLSGVEDLVGRGGRVVGHPSLFDQGLLEFADGQVEQQLDLLQ
jgi:hypothetical protein